MRHTALEYFYSNSVDGWLTAPAASLIAAITTDFTNSGRPVCEIGVHHGKLLIFLRLITGGKAVGFDLFERQDQNVDGSGKGDLERLRVNYQRYVGETSSLSAISVNSLDLDHHRILAECDAAPVLFSVDGGHTSELTRNDLNLAAQSVAEDGMVVLDDVFNESWPGVCTGLAEFFAQGPLLVPFCIVGNKVLFAKSERVAGDFRDRLAALPNTEIAGMRGRSTASFFGSQVSIITSTPSPRFSRYLASSMAWQRIRFGKYGRRMRRIRRKLLFGTS